MLSSWGKDSGRKGSNSFLGYFKHLTSSAGGKKSGLEAGEIKPITDQIELKNISFDPHLHSSLSDGIKMHHSLKTGSRLGLEGMAFADHHRDDLDDVILYNDDAYRIVDLEGDDRISANMDVLYNVVREQQESFKPENFGRPGDLDNFVKDYNQTHDDNISFIEASSLFRRVGERTNSDKTDLFRSIERDYETWNDEKTEQFLQKNEFDHVVLSTHYIPEKFVAGKPHENQTQYLRKAALEHLNEDLTDLDVEDVVDWYVEETKSKLLRSADLTHLSDQAAQKLYDSNDVEPHGDIGKLKEPIARGTPVIHSHWDLVLTSPDLRPHVKEQHIDEYLDLAEELDEIVEVNGRTIMKQRKTYASDDNFYAPEDAEWFARKVIEKAENGTLDYSIGSDAHSETELIELHLMLDSVLEDYETRPIGLEMYDREPSMSIDHRYKTEVPETLSKEI